MTTLREAAKAVLDCWDSPKWGWAPSSPTADLMAVLRAALEQSDMGIPITEKQAEPVAWIVDGGKKSGQLLYTHEYELELVAPKIMCKPLYTHPTQRKPLTLKELAELYLKHTDRPMKAHWEFARAIEQAHGIKETP